MNKYLADVVIFHQTYGQPVIEEPSIPGDDRVKLRIRLIEEELKELEVAVTDKDVIEVADALIDLLYVVNGAVIEFGLKDHIEDTNGNLNSLQKLAMPRYSHHSELFVPDSMKDHLRILGRYTLAFTDATRSANIDLVAQALSDLVYSIDCALWEMLLLHIKERLHDEVQASNMSKLDAEGKPIYNQLGKVIKGPNFFAPDLKKVIETYYNE